jgi:hypothetical protein
MSDRLAARLLLGLVIALSAATFAGCSGSPATPGDSPGDTGANPPAGGSHGAGECFHTQFNYVDCSEDHDSEIVSTFTGFDLADSADLQAADERCGEETNAFLGVDSLPQDFRYGVYDDGGAILCFVGYKDGRMTTGSLANAGG